MPSRETRLTTTADEIEKMYDNAEPLNDAEKFVAEMYIEKRWTVGNIKLKESGHPPYSLICGIDRGEKEEWHVVRVTHADGELTGKFEFEYNDKWADLSEKQIHVILDHPANIGKDEVRVRIYEVTGKEVRSCQIRGTRQRSTKAEIRRQREIAIMNGRRRGFSWTAISKHVGLSRTTIRRIHARLSTLPQ